MRNDMKRLVPNLHLDARTAALVAALALAGCGGSGTEATTEATPVAPGPACDVAGESSTAAAHCAAATSPLRDVSVERSASRVDDSDCADRPAIVVYAQLDWIRVADTMAQDGYRCGEYYISVAPTQDGDGLYTEPNRDQAKRIRSYGDGFHAMAELNVAAWTEWLARNNGKTWKDAGVEWRKRMEGAGYDAANDLWAVNELPLKMLSDPSLLADMRQLIEGLHEGAGQPAQGLVFVVSPSQGGGDLAGYRGELTKLLRDEVFWGEMRESVRFWAQEVYADPADCCVEGASADEIATRVGEYLEHALALAEREPEAAVARSYLASAYVPVANAAWGWEQAYGDTVIPPPDMERFVAAQLFAMRRFQEGGGPGAGIGLAWAPAAPAGGSPGQFLQRSASILASISRSIRASFEEDASAACGEDGTACRCTAEGASFDDRWASFGG